MARVFTTSFSYNGHSFAAVISQIGGVLNIYVPDESLHGILPQGRASFNPEQELMTDQRRLSPAERLVFYQHSF